MNVVTPYPTFGCTDYDIQFADLSRYHVTVTASDIFLDVEEEVLSY